MKNALCGALLVAALASASTSAQEHTLTPHFETETEREVAAVERAFAQTMADRDFEAFKSFLDAEGIFWSGGQALRGKDAIADAWKGLYEAEDAPFSWEPETVLVLKSGELALSTGPVTGSSGRVFSYYTSTWRKNADGEWKIIFDKGQRYCPPPAPQ